MTGLSKITDKILNDAKADAAGRLADAEARAAEIRAEYALRAEELRKSVDAEAKAEAELLIGRAKAREEAIRRNILLEARGELIDRVFEKARKEILDSPAEIYAQFIASLLAATFVAQLEDEAKNRELYGEEGDETVEKYEVLLNSRDKDALGSTLMSAVSNRLVGKSAAASLGKLTVASETVNIDGGFILRCGSMEINNSVKAIFGEIRPALEAEVSRILFGDDSIRERS